MRYFSILLGLLLVVSCARQGSPPGGPKDAEPPKFLRAIPDTLSRNVPTDLKEIKIDFDEFLVLKDPGKNIVMSPVSELPPIFLPVGSPARSVTIRFNEPLKENTTYNINFGNAIQDNNEGNKLFHFQYVFSTGDYIDSLNISGKAQISDVRKLPENIVVGLFKMDEEYNDSLILKEKPLYVSRLDSDGEYHLSYLHPGKYRLIAFEDKVENMQYDIGKEKLGFVNEPIELLTDQQTDIELFDQLLPYKAMKAEQKNYGHFVFKFTGHPEELEITPIDFDFITSKIDYKSKSDSLNFWFKPSVDSIYDRTKRLNFAVRYKDKTDTLSAVYNNGVKHSLKISPANIIEPAPGRPLKFKSSYPLNSIRDELIEVRKDSLLLEAKAIRDSADADTFTLEFPMELSSKYEVLFLPDALTDFFDKKNDSIKFNVQTKTKNDFGNLTLKLENKPSHPFWLQLLNDKDEVLDEKHTEESEFEYRNLPLGKYYFRIKVDENENGFWDTGDFFGGVQPEPVFLYPTVLNIRALWDMSETWVLPVQQGIAQEPEEDTPED